MKIKTSQSIQLKKTVTWAIISFTITGGVTWAYTGNFFAGLTVGLIDRIIKVFVYYWHERKWHKRYKEEKRHG
ncbi:hypothetical protein LCGC14_2863990 [marine sediment metagenome]|uniref:DUF2061 domain-containing protein n=1 Tax=marine sediment metagenome TaxID=412755 RepID=A0A0F8Y567_9ZZZZ